MVFYCNLCGEKTESLITNLWLNVCSNCEFKELKRNELGDIINE